MQHTQKSMKTHAQSGFTLIEAMVALVVMSVGLLAIASLQLLSKKSNYDAAQRTTAVHLAEDLLERMRANPAGLVDYTGAGTLGNGSRSAPGVDCGTAGVSCSADEMAAYDLYQWEQVLDGTLESAGGVGTGGLVSPTACITGPGFGGNGTYTVEISWRGTMAIGNPDATDCGEGSGLYGADDEFRRVLAVSTFVNAG